ncbi:hypothetical protein [Terrisporobacter mayombei]|uniref:hypothetical protein n=1 Tax=Terrisporobacter mayombei TaxID=1541 RepID=UPI001D1683C3|nr:hypothetical protein [Terrisporobacter mayombei]
MNQFVSFSISKLTLDDEVDYFIGEIKEYLDVMYKGSADMLFSIDPYREELLSRIKLSSYFCKVKIY